jgi:hypothetical protein
LVLFLRAHKNKLSGTAAMVVLLPLCLCGTAGCALAAVLLVLRRTMLPELSRFLLNVRLRFRNKIDTAIIVKLASLTVLYGVLSGVGRVSAPVAIACFVFFCAVFVAGSFLRAFEGRDTGHVRFEPVMIRTGSPALPLVSAPFNLAAFVAALLSVSVAGAVAPQSAPKWAVGITEVDWQNHVTFQTGFSTRRNSVSDTSLNTGEGYLHYTLGADGLIAGTTPYPQESGLPVVTAPEAKAFPLARFLEQGGPSISPGTAGLMSQLIPALLALLLYLPVAKKMRFRYSLINHESLFFPARRNQF